MCGEDMKMQTQKWDAQAIAGHKKAATQECRRFNIEVDVLVVWSGGNVAALYNAIYKTDACK